MDSVRFFFSLFVFVSFPAYSFDRSASPADLPVMLAELLVMRVLVLAAVGQGAGSLPRGCRGCVRRVSRQVRLRAQWRTRVAGLYSQHAVRITES